MVGSSQPVIMYSRAVTKWQYGPLRVEWLMRMRKQFSTEDMSAMMYEYQSNPDWFSTISFHS